ncbi:MAG TPA: isoprenylcysteine carboxylmethyltransferase family protein [Candidatus Angelobacter sp.]|nr:isoprenylcysteine carboxylmethyltransferase family protein [Candidatus Angelobacter sp.]
MTPTGKIIIACWCIFVIVWLIAASRTKRIAERQSFESALAHRIPVAVGWWLMAVPKWHGFLGGQVIPRTELWQITGAAICILGLLFTLWARQTLAGNWSSDVTFKENHELIRKGPYRIVRHPIYTGLLVMFLGTAIYIGQVRGIVSLALVTAGFWIKLLQEERLLLRHFPDAYPAYRREVKALIPFVI